MENSQEPRSERMAAALAMLAEGNSIGLVADVFGVPPSVLGDWARQGLHTTTEPIEKIENRRAMRQGRPGTLAPVPAVSWEALGVLALTIGMLAFFLWGTVPVFIDSVKGSPPIEQLHRVSGWVKTWRDCYSAGRNLRFEDVTLVGDNATVTATIPCVLPPRALADGKAHRMTVLTAQKRRLGTIVYEVDLDDHALLAYADVKRDQDDPWRGIAFTLPVLFALLIAFAAALWRYFSERHANDQSMDI